MVLVSVFKPQEAMALRNHVDIALKAAVMTYMEEVKKKNVLVKVNSNNLMHTALQPEGDTFTIQVVLEVHEKQKQEE
jgi:hypothetical protein